jgi:hypothetical protein
MVDANTSIRHNAETAKIETFAMLFLCDRCASTQGRTSKTSQNQHVEEYSALFEMNEPLKGPCIRLGLHRASGCHIIIGSY